MTAIDGDIGGVERPQVRKQVGRGFDQIAVAAKD